MRARPRGGWYGGAFTFYSGDVSQTLPRNTKTQTQWYMLSGYTHWQGRRLFVDTQGSFAYGDFVGTRDLAVGSALRRAEGKRAALMLALGGKMGAKFGNGFQFTPHLSVDGLAMREEGYTETGGGPGFNLQVNPVLRQFAAHRPGCRSADQLPLWSIRITPEARFGYRYDLVSSPMKLKGGFVSTGGDHHGRQHLQFRRPRSRYRQHVRRSQHRRRHGQLASGRQFRHGSRQ